MRAEDHHFCRYVFLITRTVLLSSIAMASFGGCAGIGPKLFPERPLATSAGRAYSTERSYDLDHDRQVDFIECLDAAGRIVAVNYVGVDSIPIILDQVRRGQCRHLLIILDSVPYEVAKQVWDSGRLRLFPPPTRIVSVFPAMTDPAIAEFFGVAPCRGVESVCYDGETAIVGFDAYWAGQNAPWLNCVNWWLEPANHTWAYIAPGPWFLNELGEIQRAFLQAPAGSGASEPGPASKAAGVDWRRPFVGYCVGTSALGSRDGWAGHVRGLECVDRLCQQIVYETHGAVNMTIMSDHGHTPRGGKRISMAPELRRLGYNVGLELKGPRDVVLPEFGLVSYAGVYTNEPASVARDLASAEGVDLLCYVAPGPGKDQVPTASSTGERVVVMNNAGEAEITRRSDGRFRYAMQRGDPLKLTKIIEGLSKSGAVDSDGYIDDRALFDATVTHEYPDPLHRLWRGFHGLFEFPPQVMISLADGYYSGSVTLDVWMHMEAVHGGLGSRSSCGFVASTRGGLPPAVRMEDLRKMLDIQPAGTTP